MPNAAIWNRLCKLGLRPAAEALKEAVRIRLRNTPDPNTGQPLVNRSDTNLLAEDEMWSYFRPACEHIETLLEKSKASANDKINSLKDKLKSAKLKATIVKNNYNQTTEELELDTSYQNDNIDSLLDTNYSETNPSRWIRDGIIWVASEFRRVVSDYQNHATINLQFAKSPPPNAWALFVLESFARKPPAKRSDLITRLITIANRYSSEQQNTQNHTPENDDYLDSID